MTNDPRDLDGRRLQTAIHALGRDPFLRKELIDFLKLAERSLKCSGAVRDEITGPIVDALHDSQDIYEKSLADGTRFKFLFRTKIARDFLMADDEAPTHVWEPQTTKLMLKLAAICSGDVVVGGAYFGDQAILVAKSLMPLGRCVHCFEPNQDQAAMLEENIRINSLNNVRVNKIGLWSKSNVRLKLDGFDSFANAVEAGLDEDSFPTITIDDYRSQQGVDIGLIQVDIEGAELGALQGAIGTLVAKQPNVVFEVHRDYVDWTGGLENTEICRLLLDLGYSVFAVRDFNTHHEMVGKPVELIPVATVYLDGPPHGFNMLAVKDVDILANSGFRIVAGVSPKLLAHKSPALHHPIDGL
jgi:FkbM family methyltransferase